MNELAIELKHNAKKEEPHMHPGGAPGMGGMDY